MFSNIIIHTLLLIASYLHQPDLKQSTECFNYNTFVCITSLNTGISNFDLKIIWSEGIKVEKLNW